jgi:hypothetical protein
MYEDRADLLLTVWRALGMMYEWPGGSYTVYGEPAGFLFQSLEKLSAEDYARALARLPGQDRVVWLGACRQMVSGQASRPEHWKGWEIRLADYFFAESKDAPRGEWVRFLDKLKTAEADAMLLRIAGAADVKDSANDESDEMGISADGFTALRLLAQRRVPAARVIIEQKLAADPGIKNRLVLEVFRACYEGAQRLRPEHLTCESHTAELAWNLYSSSADKREDVEILGAAAKSSSYTVRQQATARLAAYGLMPLTPKAEDRKGRSARGKGESWSDVIARYSEQLAHEKYWERRMPLHAARGRAYLESGDYAAALKDLRRGGKEVAHERALSAYALGRYGESLDAMYRMEGGGDELARMLFLKACLRHSMGEWQEALDHVTASAVLNHTAYALVFRHLTLLQIGRVAESPLKEWEPVFLGEYAPNYPDEVLLFLQGKGSRENMLKAAEEGAAVDPEEVCQARSVLAALARLEGDSAGERRELERAVAAKAFASPWHVRALRRLIELDEIAREKSGP